MKACYEPSPSPCATRTTYQAISRIVYKDIHDASISGGSWAAQPNLADSAPIASPRQWLSLWRRSSMVKVRSGPKAQPNIQTPLWPLCCLHKCRYTWDMSRPQSHRGETQRAEPFKYLRSGLAAAEVGTNIPPVHRVRGPRCTWQCRSYCTFNTSFIGKNSLPHLRSFSSPSIVPIS